MSNLKQKVVVIQDASKDLCLSTLKWVLTGFELKPGDELILLALLHQITSPMGYKMKVGSCLIFGANNKVIKVAIHNKKDEYENSIELLRVHDIYEANKVGFSVLVIPAASVKNAAMEAAKISKATWVILNRHLKKDQKYFLQRLSCGIARIKKDKSIELMRWSKSHTQIRTSERDGVPGRNIVNYDQVVMRETSDDLNPNKNVIKKALADAQVDISHISKASSSNYSILTVQNTEAIYSKDIYETAFLSAEDTLNQIKNIEGNHPIESSTMLKNSFCSQCGNERPKMERMIEFTYAELYLATEKFSNNNFLAEGGFGSVFKGKLVNGSLVAVKQHGRASLQGEKEFKREVYVLSKARHENVVTLLGSCAEGNHRLLVYEYVCNRSLDHHLSDDRSTVLSWKDRLKIALGAAKGLQYLHSLDIIHRDMRPSNILVTHDFQPMLGDFGLARSQCDGVDGSSGHRVVGTAGYVAPEYFKTARVSKKSDVYSFAVVLLELISGRRTFGKSLQEASLVEWARPLLKERNYQELIDPRIMDSHDVHQLFGMVQIIEHCISKDPEKRPSMDELIDP